MYYDVSYTFLGENHKFAGHWFSLVLSPDDFLSFKKYVVPQDNLGWIAIKREE